MQIILELTGDNTTQKKDVGANLQILVHLESIWPSLEKGTNFYVNTKLEVPIEKDGSVSLYTITVRNTYSKDDVMKDATTITVNQFAYLEQIPDDLSTIDANSTIWIYTIQQSNSEEGGNV